MQLSYRGISYQATFPVVETDRFEIIGTYRGIQLKRPNLKQAHPINKSIELTFLGNRYYR